MDEMCNDWFTCDLGTVAAIDPVGPPTGIERVVRGGGSIINYAWNTLRSAERGAVGIWGDTVGPFNISGFRAARTVIP